MLADMLTIREHLGQKIKKGVNWFYMGDARYNG